VTAFYSVVGFIDSAFIVRYIRKPLCFVSNSLPFQSKQNSPTFPDFQESGTLHLVQDSWL